MPSFRVKSDTNLFSEPSETSIPLAGLGEGDLLKFPQGLPSDPFISVVMDGFPPTPGFVLRSKCEEIPDPPGAAIDPETFVRDCLIAEYRVNQQIKKLQPPAPFYALADFIIARALFETDVKDEGSLIAGSDGVGPLQVGKSEWKDFLDHGKPIADEFEDSFRSFPTLQIYGAAFRMHADGKAISALKPGIPETKDPFLPSYLDLFHAYLTDPKAAAAIKDAEKDNAKKLKDVGVSDAQIKAISSRKPFKDITLDTPVPAFVAKTEEVLTKALQDAFDLIKKFAPESVPPPPPAGSASWMDVAKKELAAGVSEATAMPRIKEYFRATDFPPLGAGDAPAWCGAFAAFCMQESGNKANIPKGAAAAASWGSFGKALPASTKDIPDGAVIVLSGHVAFFKKDTGKLLGGNQSNKVSEMPFSPGSVVAIRFLETVPASGKFNLAAEHIKPEFFQYGDLIIDRFSRAGFSPVQQLAALANAIGESRLDPKIKSAGSERSFGLFQCNQGGGLGSGFSEEELKDPEINIGIIIKEAKKFKEFTQATTIEDAIGAFVRFIERPADAEGAIATRLNIARKISA